MNAIEHMVQQMMGVSWAPRRTTASRSTPDLRRRIRVLLQEEYTQDAICKALGVSPRMVILERKRMRANND